MPREGTLSISIVSHRQGPLVRNLLFDLHEHCRGPFEVILTINAKEDLPFNVAEYDFPIKVLFNETRKGFAANHNAAFRHAAADYYCVLNPDIRIKRDPFPELIDVVANPSVGVVGPLIVSPAGHVEDSARRFPTVLTILGKLLLPGHSRLDYEIGTVPLSPDWIAGMFMMFRSDAFRAVNGFDERYFLYYEDVDICLRLRQLGYDVQLEPRASAIHDARRQSHRDPRHLMLHAGSLCRFLFARGRPR